MASGSGWNLWAWLAGGECGCKEIFIIPTPLVSALFFSSIPTFLFIFKNVFRSYAWLATYVLGPPPSRGGDLELDGGVNVVLVKIWRSTWNNYLVWHLNVIVR